MPTTSKITLKVEDATSRDRQLELTCAVLARETTSCGILVTRVDHTTFEVALSSDVQFGLITEVDLL